MYLLLVSFRLHGDIVKLFKENSLDIDVDAFRIGYAESFHACRVSMSIGSDKFTEYAADFQNTSVARIWLYRQFGQFLDGDAGKTQFFIDLSHDQVDTVSPKGILFK
jgi:hypothetical protein